MQKKTLTSSDKKEPKGTTELTPSTKSKTIEPSKNATNVKVMCRVRPLNEKEKEMLEASKLQPNIKQKDMCVEFNSEDKSAITVFVPNEKPEKDPFEKHEFRLDYIFDCNTDQAEVYDIAAKPIVKSVLEGFNGTVLAYGQTSSGKTFTMQGDIESDIYRGIIPRMIETIFEAIMQASESMEFTVKASMIEIYNEKIRDLLDPSKDNLSVHEEKQRGIYVEGLTETSIGDEYAIYELMRQGNSNRAIAETKMNAQSSRSHSIFILTMIMNDTENLSCKTGKLYLVDLAGSEMISKTGASGQTLEEAKNINKSLTMLGRVITALTDGKSSHIPYRDSKLTRILQDSLGGNAKTCLIITASPSMYNATETLSTCRFGVRAKSIKNNAKVNKQVTLSELKLAIAVLEKELASRNKRVNQLEGFISSKGFVLNGDDEERMYTAESDKSSLEDSISEYRTTIATEVGVDLISPMKEEGLTVSLGAEEEKGKLESATIFKLYNQLEQQRELITKPMLEKEREEQQNDIDTLINQLRHERGRSKEKDKKVKELLKELNARTEEVEAGKNEILEFTRQLQEKEALLKDLKKELDEKILSMESNEIKETPEKLKEAVIRELLSDPDLDSKAKEIIAKKASVVIDLVEHGDEDEDEAMKIMEDNKKMKKEICDLQAKLIKERDFYKKQMESNSIELWRRKLTILERKMEELTKNYNNHISTITGLNISLEMKKKEIERKNRKIEDLEKQIGKVRIDLNQSKAMCEELKNAIWENVANAEEILSQQIFNTATPFYVYQANVIRSIRGGGGKL